jgi:hypothetical protein
MVARTSESDPWLTTSAVNEPVLGAAGSILIASRPPFGRSCAEFQAKFAAACLSPNQNAAAERGFAGIRLVGPRP